MSTKKKSGTGVGVGGSSILVIFILLCLTTFATLSMVSANADLRLTEKTVDAAGEYYAADAKAEIVLAKIDGILATGTDSFEEVVASQLPEVAVEAGSNGEYTLRYQVDVNDRQALSVRLRVPGGASAPEERYRLEEWTVIATAEWQPQSNGFTLWGAEDWDTQPGLAGAEPPL